MKHHSNGEALSTQKMQKKRETVEKSQDLNKSENILQKFVYFQFYLNHSIVTYIQN